MIKKYFIVFALLWFLITNISCKKESSVVAQDEQTDTKTVVNHFGLIKAKGNQLIDKNDKPVVLRGMSLFWSQWGGSYYNEKIIQWLRDDWKCTVVRTAMGIESGGYLENKNAELQKVYTVVDAAIKYGIYVIIDWHDHNAQNHLAQAKDFFKTIAQKYGDKANIIYEIYNEPLQVSWTNVIKPYLVEVIKEIRQYDPDNLIVVGTPTWSQDVDVAAKDPVVDNNVAYSLHFYTSTHKESLRIKAKAALNIGVALFVNEFGISEASGTGNIDLTETSLWIKFMTDNNLSSCNWSIIDKNESSAALKTGASATGNWKDSDLTDSGKYNREYIRMLNTQIYQTITGD